MLGFLMINFDLNLLHERDDNNEISEKISFIINFGFCATYLKFIITKLVVC